MTRYSFEQNGEVKGFYELNRFPGNAQIVVSNHTFIEEKHRGCGIGTDLMKHKDRHAVDLGFDYMISTVVASNERMIKAALRSGYKELDRFYNHETEKEIVLFGKGLR